MWRLGLLAAAAVLATPVSSAAQPRPVVLVAELEGIIHPIAAEYVDEVIDASDASGAAAVVFVLRTPGGLLESTRTIVSRMIASRAPVVVFVGPAGARAASAGFIITLASDVAVMAPGTHIGAAHPVSATGGAADETVSSKAASDTAAYARSLASARGRNVMLSGEAVLESRAFTDGEALEAMPPLIDFVARDVEEVIRRIDGLMARRFDGRTQVVKTAGAEVRRIGPTWRQRFLGAIAHPQVAYLLLTLGLLGLTVELWNPGAIAPGVAGGVCLLLAFFAFQIVPIDTVGLLLILFGLGLLVLELNVPSFGVLGVGGAVALTIGSVMATREVPGVRVGLTTIVPATLALTTAVLLLGRLALRAQRQPPQTGAQGLIGLIGRSRTDLGPDTAGQIDAHGEIWGAVSREPLPPGTAVRVVAMEGLTLRVEPVHDPPTEQEGAPEWKP
jgi:membrane-bound serine protease (ClpP class)